MDKTLLENIYRDNEAKFLNEWKEFLRIPSISTDPQHDGDCRRCAEWLVEHLRAIGFESSLLETPSKPVVYATRTGSQPGPRVLFYGHYDVQPVDPVAEWQSSPFEPTLRDGRLYARGAVDDKGQVFYVLKALQELIKRNELKVPVTIVLEGEEECGSEGFMARLPSWKDKLGADILMVCDTGTMKAGIPAITMGLRAVAYCTVTLGGLRKDLHSGVHGGMVKNPATELARLIATLHDSKGRVAVRGFYEGVKDPDPHDKELVNRMPMTMAEYEAMIGVEPLGGEEDYSPLERRGFRPCLDLNGIYGGYSGPGRKTIIPASASAKISTRLVAGQDPQRCIDLIISHLKANAPRGLKIEIEGGAAPGRAISLSANSALIEKTSAVLKELSGYDPLYIWEGASIPVVSTLADLTGAEPLLVGFGLEEDNMHAPNESFSLDQFRDGFMYACMILNRL